jgi:hypothetical protein
MNINGNIYYKQFAGLGLWRLTSLSTIIQLYRETIDY